MKNVIVAAFLLVCAVLVVGLVGRKPAEVIEAQTPSARDHLGETELATMTQRATNGDCAAAGKLRSHYANVALDLDSAVKWGRVAANCPDPLAKEMLVVLLVQQEGPQVEAEIDTLLREIGKVDAASAERLSRTVQRVRTESSTDQLPGREGDDKGTKPESTRN